MTCYAVTKAYSIAIFFIQVLLQSLCTHDGTEEREAQKRTKNVLNKNKIPGLNHSELYCSITSARWPPCPGASFTALTPAMAVPWGFISALHVPELKLLLPLSLCAVHRPQHLRAAAAKRFPPRQPHAAPRSHLQTGSAPRPAPSAAPAALPVSRIGAGSTGSAPRTPGSGQRWLCLPGSWPRRCIRAPSHVAGRRTEITHLITHQ